VVSTVQAGTTLDGGKYRVVRLIAAGGMGEVYEAKHTVMDKRVAIKWIRPGLSTKARATERMMQEARAASRIHHPNVVDIYDVNREGDAVYLVMEYLEGETLSDLLARGRMPMHRLIALLVPAMRGVAAAHRHGVVHRDIKPDNIFLASVHDVRDPMPKVLDFGVSKLEPRGGEQLTLTRSGGTVGTPLYMAYEQLLGSKQVDGRADVYAFGVILYEALTGRLPHVAESYPELIVKVTTASVVPSREHNAEIPAPLDRIISWALAREPEQRIPSMDALIRELEPFATEVGFRADMDTVEIPSTPCPAPKAPRDDSQFAHDSTAFSSALRGSKHLSAVRTTTTRARRRRVLALAALVLLSTIGFALSRRAPPATPSVAPAASPPAPARRVYEPSAIEPPLAAKLEVAPILVAHPEAADAAVSPAGHSSDVVRQRVHEGTAAAVERTATARTRTDRSKRADRNQAERGSPEPAQTAESVAGDPAANTPRLRVPVPSTSDFF
jgi:serine/threonine-protein kinase